MTHRHRRAVLVTMRNEALGLLEWIAYHRAIGFDAVFVATNDCKDGTDTLLSRIAAADPAVVHIPHAPAPGTSPQEAGCALAFAHPAMQDVEWVLHIDADEFLHVSLGDGRIDTLLDAVGPSDAIAITWRMFGSAGHRSWPGGNVLENFLRTEARLRRARSLQKCLFRPDRFRRVFSHLPKDPIAPDVVLKNTEGRTLPTDALFHPTLVRHRTADPRHFTWRHADIHHYAIRSEDLFLMKNDRGDGLSMNTGKYLRGSSFWQFADANAVEDRKILRHMPATRGILDRYRQDPAVTALEAAALTWFTQRRQEVLVNQSRFGWSLGPASTPEQNPPADASEKALR